MSRGSLRNPSKILYKVISNYLKDDRSKSSRMHDSTMLLLVTVVASMALTALSLPPPTTHPTTTPTTLWMKSTTPPWTDTTPEPPTTPLSACETWDGQILQPGEEKTIGGKWGCVIYSCTSAAELEVIYGDCMMSMCVDPVQGSCCMYCPNGNNCWLPSGDILQTGETVIDGGLECRCPDQEYYFWFWDETLTTYAICTPLAPSTISPPPTTMPPACTTPDGKVLYPGDSHTVIGHGWCEVFECSMDGELMQLNGDCIPPMCVDPVQGGCCMYCPNGDNCRLPSGNILQAGETVIDSGMECTCPEQEYDFGGWEERLTIAVCAPVPTTTCVTLPPTDLEGCVTDDGCWLTLRPGQEMVQGCKRCKCLENGTAICSMTVCQQLACVDALIPPDGCCELCPNGKNCLTPSGEIIPAGRTVGAGDGNKCRCPNYQPGDVWNPKQLTAYCWNVKDGTTKEERIAAMEQMVREKRRATRRRLRRLQSSAVAEGRK